MQRVLRNIAVSFAVLAIVGCNRQDADALAKIGQILSERARSLPTASPHGKLVKGLPMSLGTEQELETDKK